MSALLVDILKHKRIRLKLLFTLNVLVIYRLGMAIPIPGTNSSLWASWAASNSGTSIEGLVELTGIITGGTVGHSAIFGLGLAPLGAALYLRWCFEQIGSNSPGHVNKTANWLRFNIGIPVLLFSLVQSAILTHFFVEKSLVQAGYADDNLRVFWLISMCALTAGSMFLWWLSEQITAYGIGYGPSLILVANGIARLPYLFSLVISQPQMKFSIDGANGITPIGLLILFAAFVCTIIFIIVTYGAQRRVPVQQATMSQTQTDGAQGTAELPRDHRYYLPVSMQGNSIPGIYTHSVLAIFWIFLEWIRGMPIGKAYLASQYPDFQLGGYGYALGYTVLIFYFSFLIDRVEFGPYDTAKSLRDTGRFIPGLRPGLRTGQYLEAVISRVVFYRASLLVLTNAGPMFLASLLNARPIILVPFVGVTSTIVPGVLSFVQKLEAQILSESYQGLLKR